MVIEPREERDKCGRATLQGTPRPRQIAPEHDGLSGLRPKRMALPEPPSVMHAALATLKAKRSVDREVLRAVREHDAEQAACFAVDSARKVQGIPGTLPF
jgi:hypothetical protein